MIQKPNSQQLMERFEAIENQMADIRNDLDTISKQIEAKIDIIKTYDKTIQNRLNDITESTQKDGHFAYAIKEEIKRTQNSIFFGLDQEKIIGGSYDQYGQTIHPQFAALPSQIFNFITEAGPLFKDCASVSFIYDKNGEEYTDYQYDYCNILKQEGDISKQDVFKWFPEEYVTLRIELNHTNLYGNTFCNMIELCPYLPGTFDIEQIDLYSLSQYMAEGDEMNIVDTDQGSVTIHTPMKDVGTCRFMLNGQTCQIYRADFKIRIHQQENGYPFGLRHIYFYHAQMDTENDYAVIALEQNNYIESIGDRITVMTPFGSSDKTMSEMGIELYMFYGNGLLENKIDSGDMLGRNLKTIYIKVPFSMPDTENKQVPYCLTAIVFKEIKLR